MNKYEKKQQKNNKTKQTNKKNEQAKRKKQQSKNNFKISAPMGKEEFVLSNSQT